MIIHKKLGNLSSFDAGRKAIDLLPVEWFETKKRILHKQTSSGKSIVVKFLDESPDLLEGDVLYADELVVVAVEIQSCEAIVIRPSTMQEMAAICYEIGNKHLPLFSENDEVLVPFDAPLYRMLTAAAYAPRQERRKLLYPVKTSVAAHSHGGSGSLFSRILQLTNPSPGV
jgi:urease accessory protein